MPGCCLHVGNPEGRNPWSLGTSPENTAPHKNSWIVDHFGDIECALMTHELIQVNMSVLFSCGLIFDSIKCWNKTRSLLNSPVSSDVQEALHHKQQEKISAGLQQLSPWTAMALLAVLWVSKCHFHLQMDKQNLSMYKF